MSDITINDSNEENVNYEEENMPDTIEQDDSIAYNDLDETDENTKFPIPKNIMLNNINPKSSSYYRPVDDRLESDSDSDIAIQNEKRSIKRNEESAKISPNTEINDPIFIYGPSDRLIRIGETARFQCKVDGTKPLAVFWYKIDGDELQNNEKYELFHDDEFYYLKIYNTVQRDSGTYLCVVANDVNQNVHSFTLKLRGLFNLKYFIFQIKLNVLGF